MSEVLKEATRESYGKALVELAKTNPDFVVLDADLAAATKTGIFKKAYPERFYDCGIAEQNMMGVAAGIAATGKTVFASSFAMFAAGRAYEQIRNSICYPRLNVKICATHAGISVGEDGATHQCNEDMALMRSLPGMTVINPADAAETRAAVFAAAQIDGPVYIRLSRFATPAVFADGCTFEPGKGQILKDGRDVTIMAVGLMVHEALLAADILEKEGIAARVIDMAYVKPLDCDLVIASAKETGAIVTAEEHSVIGGLGSAVCDAVCGEYPVPVEKVGVKDTFGFSGPAADLLDMFGLRAENIADAARRAVARK